MRKNLFAIGGQPKFLQKSILNKSYELESPKKKTSKDTKAKALYTSKACFKEVLIGCKHDIVESLDDLREINIYVEIDSFEKLGLIDPLNWQQTKDETILYQMNDTYKTYEPYHDMIGTIQENYSALQKRMGDKGFVPVELGRRLSVDKLTSEVLNLSQ